MEIGDLKDIENQNVFHIRIIYYLWMNYGFKKVISIYEIAKHFKKGNITEYTGAKEELKNVNYIKDLPKEICLDPEKKQNKDFIEGVKKNPEIPLILRKYEERNIERLYKQDKKISHSEMCEKIYKIFKEAKSSEERIKIFLED